MRFSEIHGVTFGARRRCESRARARVRRLLVMDTGTHTHTHARARHASLISQFSMSKRGRKLAYCVQTPCMHIAPVVQHGTLESKHHHAQYYDKCIHGNGSTTRYVTIISNNTFTYRHTHTHVHTRRQSKRHEQQVAANAQHHTRGTQQLFYITG
jgi:ribosomal protein S26